MGTADVIPGVSGGTMALILGIYQRLLEAIRSFDLALLRLVARGEVRKAASHTDLRFLVPLAIGIFAALMFFTRVVSLPHLVRTEPELVFALFFGLIGGSIVVLLRGLDALKVADVTALIVGALAGFVVVNLVPVETPETSWFVFITGAIAISALILPGLSGSFLLLILKKYAYVFDAVGRLDLTVLIPFALGAMVGLMGFSRVLVWLLHHHYQRTLVTIVGVLIGSLWVIWPFQERIYQTIRGKERLLSSQPLLPASLDGATWLAIGLMLAGFVVVLWLSSLVNRPSESTAADTP